MHYAVRAAFELDSYKAASQTALQKRILVKNRPHLSFDVHDVAVGFKIPSAAGSPETMTGFKQQRDRVGKVRTRAVVSVSVKRSNKC